MTRLADAWRALERERRTAALVSLGLFASMLLPWYSKTSTFVEHNAAKASQASLSAFQAFSFVEAAVLLVSAGVLAMLFARAEGRDFQLPGGDGLIVMIAGGWAALLIFYRLLDKPGLQGNQRITATVGVEWGIFIALLLALALLYAGRRIRASELERPPAGGPRGPRLDPERDRRDREAQQASGRPASAADLPADSTAARRQETTALSPSPARAGARPRYPPAPSDQMSFEDAPPAGE